MMQRLINSVNSYFRPDMGPEEYLIALKQFVLNFKQMDLSFYPTSDTLEDIISGVNLAVELKDMIENIIYDILFNEINRENFNERIEETIIYFYNSYKDSIADYFRIKDIFGYFYYGGGIEDTMYDYVLDFFLKRTGVLQTQEHFVRLEEELDYIKQFIRDERVIYNFQMFMNHIRSLHSSRILQPMSFSSFNDFVVNEIDNSFEEQLAEIADSNRRTMDFTRAIDLFGDFEDPDVDFFQTFQEQQVEEATRPRDAIPYIQYKNFPINKIKEENVDRIDKRGETTCSICLEEWEDTIGRNVITLPCEHTLHLECAKGSFDRFSSCPTCRYDLQQAVFGNMNLEVLEIYNQNKFKVPISALTKLTLKKEVDEDCGYCDKDIEDVGVILPCGDIFHPECVISLFKKSDSCNVCEKKLFYI
jgi:hypothetical protein